MARLREGRGDIQGAADALVLATTLAPESLDRWSALERVAGVAGREDVRLRALVQVAERQDLTARVPVLKRLARAYEERDEFREAEAIRRRVAEAAPDDEEADHAIEALISALRNYADLASHLERRTQRLAKVPGAREALRAVRLRRAAILEQRLGRTRDACAELALVLDESPDNVSALSYLADFPATRRVRQRSSDLAARGASQPRPVGAERAGSTCRTRGAGGARVSRGARVGEGCAVARAGSA